MNLDLNIGYWGTALAGNPALLREIEALGYRCIWAAEAYGSDAVSVLSAIAAHTERLSVGSAILQMAARTPAMTAMTAATLDDMNPGRFRLGLGVSGPQVVEGWHGVSYGHPLQRTREYVQIVRSVLARQSPLEFSGVEYQIPLRGPRTTGLGKPLKLIGQAHPDIQIYLAAIGPRMTALTAEIADGWLPIFYSPERAGEVFGESLGSRDKHDFDIVPTVQVDIDDDLEASLSRLKPLIALYVGGMGAKGKNFYNDLATRYGYGKEAATIQDLYLSGDKEKATAAVPDALVDEVALAGPPERIRDRLEIWRESGIDSMAIATMSPTVMRTMAELVLG